jgi:hypothetical protein
MWEQVKEDQTFPDIGSLFWLCVQGNYICIYNIVSSLSCFISWHDPIKTSSIHVLLIEGACNHCKYGNKTLLWKHSQY